MEERSDAPSDALKALELQARHGRGNKDKYAFWETQPVAQFSDAGSSKADGPIDAVKKPEDVRQEPWKLPAPFEWKNCDLTDDDMLNQVYELLTRNYVEDDDNMFRFDYSPAFLKWAMCPPGWKEDWLLGVVDSRNGKLFAFISAVPVHIRARDKTVPMAEVNFLCVHKKLRSRRLAPVLIKEITRRVNLCDQWQAVYTAGVVIPKPVATARYWHRSLEPKKLIEVGFSRLARNMTMARTIKLYKLPESQCVAGWREMTPADAPRVTEVLRQHLSKYQLAPVMSEEEVVHWVMPREGVVYSYVVEVEGEIKDVCSFYSLPSTVLGNEAHDTLNAAFMFYSCANHTPLQDLMQDALIAARKNGFDVFNALDILENQAFLKELKFAIGDGSLHYYLYNWFMSGGTKDTPPLQPSEVGLVML